MCHNANKNTASSDMDRIDQSHRKFEEEDFTPRWDVIAPSERDSNLSNISIVVKNDPNKLIKKTEVGKCFRVNGGNMTSHDWSASTKGFDVLNILEKNFYTSENN